MDSNTSDPQYRFVHHPPQRREAFLHSGIVLCFRMLQHNRKTNEHGPVSTRKHEQHPPSTDRRQSDYDNGHAPTYGSKSVNGSRPQLEDLPRSRTDHDSLVGCIAFWLHVVVGDVVSEVNQTESLTKPCRCSPCAVRRCDSSMP